MRVYRTYREWNPDIVTRPRLVWFFEGQRVNVGLEVSNTYTDPPAGFTVAIDLTEREADRLDAVLLALGRTICRLRGHRYELVSMPPGHPDNRNPRKGGLWFSYEQCERCRHLIPRRDRPIAVVKETA